MNRPGLALEIPVDGKAEKKLAVLRTRLAGLAQARRFALAFSGGLDSRFLAHTAKRAGLRPLLLHAEGPHMAAGESRFARQWADANGMDLLPLKVDPLADPDVAANGRLRCYHCKRLLFTRLLRQAGALPLCDGTQASDSAAYRPGALAVKELGIISPLADVGLAKAEIRELAVATGMDFPDQRARPCLLTRFAYSLPPEYASLAALDKAEERIEALLREFAQKGFGSGPPDFRLRHVAPGILELHLAPLETASGGMQFIPPVLQTSLQTAVREATGVIPSAIRVLPKLSGFFDQGSAEQG